MFPAFVGMPAKPAGSQVFRISGNFLVPKANFFIVDVWGGGGSGEAHPSAAGGGGGGARHRVLISKEVLRPGMLMPVVIGAGGAAVGGGAIPGNAGGKSSFGSLERGCLVEAYGGGGGASGVGGGGGGIASAGDTGGKGGRPHAYSSGVAVSGFTHDATSDFGGAAGAQDSGETVVSGNAVWGGGGGGS